MKKKEVVVLVKFKCNCLGFFYLFFFRFDSPNHTILTFWQPESFDLRRRDVEIGLDWTNEEAANVF